MESSILSSSGCSRNFRLQPGPGCHILKERKQSLSLVFRDGGVQDLPAAARLLLHSFPNVYPSRSEWEEILADSPRGGAETLWVGEEDGRLVAVCRMYRLQQWIGGVTIPVMGLGAVAISPDARRRGLAGRLVSSGLRRARSRGDLGSVLYPFRTAFYRQLGYGMAGEVQQFRFPPGRLRDHPARDRVRVVTTQDDRDAIADVYDRWAPGQTGQLLRSSRAWDLVWQDDTRHGVIWTSAQGEAEGYAIYHYAPDLRTGIRALDVEEFAWITNDARLGMLAWLGSLSDQWDQVIYRAHPDELFAENLSELRDTSPDVPRWHFWFPAATLLHGPMFRLLDLSRAWRARPVLIGPSLTVALEVQDGDIPENQGSWNLRFAGGRAFVGEGRRTEADFLFTLGIETLSRLYIGSLTPSAAVAAGLATTDRTERLGDLDTLLRVPRPWTYDRF